MEPIEHFRKHYYFLSNFFRSTITYKGHQFPTVEHAFQAAKCTSTADFEKILNCETPYQAKKLGLLVAIQDNWDSKRVDIMRQILKEKFCKNPHLKELLVNTGQRKIVEGNYFHDNYWGQCMCEEHRNIQGENMLGKLLMEIRNDCSA